MKTFCLALISVFFMTNINAQFVRSEAVTWDRFPPEVQKPGYDLYKHFVGQMDTTREPEDVLLFSKDNGHYPYFDLFKLYYVIVGHYTKKVKYISDIVVADTRNLSVEDRNNDGMYEIYRKYIKDGKFKTDSAGNHLKAVWLYDRIYMKDSNGK